MSERLAVRRLATSLVVLVALAGACKRSSPEPTPPDPSGGDPVGEVEAEGPSKPEGCDDPDDCMAKGTMAFLAGDASGVAMLDYACASDSASACQNLSTALRSGAVPEDPIGAHTAAKRGCELGNFGACVDLGVDESMGLGGATQDFAAASEHFTTACEGGEAKGCRYVGVLHHEGTLGSPDPAAAMTWFEKACSMQDSESCFNAGVLIVNGALGEPDLEAARGFLSRACELGDADACAAIEQIDAELAAQSKIPGANLRIGSATVNDFTVDAIECRVEGGGMGLLGNMALIAALAERKTAIDKCGEKGSAVEVTWTASGGKITKAEGVGSEGACVAKQLKKLSTPVDGECAATIVLGS
ncbi:tetratricopeptide repeat protein [Nannocystaceae bacterium ST9]